MVEVVPLEQTLQTPSREDGVSRELEEQLRSLGVELLQRATRLLRLSQLISVSAAAILQRFYYRRSLAEFDIRLGAQAALLIACKLEEQHRRVNDIVTVFHRLQMRAEETDGSPTFAGGPTPALDPATRDSMKHEVIRVERRMLGELGFAVSLLLEHPHKYVIQFVKSMVRSPQSLVKELAQTAWNYLNDATRTALCCEHQPHCIAVASIYLAAKHHKVKLPTSPPWWTVFDTSKEDMQAIAKTILKLYKRPAVSYHLSAPPRRRHKATQPAAAVTDFAPTPLASPPSEEEKPEAEISHRKSSRSRSPRQSRKVVKLTVQARSSKTKHT